MAVFRSFVLVELLPNAASRLPCCDVALTYSDSTLRVDQNPAGFGVVCRVPPADVIELRVWQHEPADVRVQVDAQNDIDQDGACLLGAPRLDIEHPLSDEPRAGPVVGPVFEHPGVPHTLCCLQ